MFDAIFVPRGAEAGAVRAAVARARSTIRVIETGVGPLGARRSTDDALLVEPIGGALITGLCGLLSPAFAVGEALLYAQVQRDGATPLDFDRALCAALTARLPKLQTGIRAFASDRVITTAAAKRALFIRTGAETVDMETFAVTERLKAAGVAVAAVRIASDAQADALPDLDRALAGDDGLNGRALALACLRRPGAGLRLVRNGVRALASLRRTIEALTREPGAG